MTDDAPLLAPTFPETPWLTPNQAAGYLGVPFSTILSLVETEQITLHRSPDQGLRFHRDHLDALLLPVAASDAALLLCNEDASCPPGNPMNSSSPESQKAVRSGTFVPLKTAAQQLHIPYKTLLRLVHAGQIAATNLGSASRPRFVVDPQAIARQWADMGQRDMRRRSAPTATLDYSRMLSQPKRSPEVSRG